MQLHNKLKRQPTTFHNIGSKQIHKTSSEESQQSRLSIRESKLCTVSIASFPFEKDQILLGKPAVDKLHMMMSNLTDITQLRYVPHSIVQELTPGYIESKLEEDENFFEFLMTKLVEPDLKELFDLAVEQFPTVFDASSIPLARERQFITSCLTNSYHSLLEVDTHLLHSRYAATPFSFDPGIHPNTCQRFGYIPRIFLLTAKLGNIEVLDYLYHKWRDELNLLQITDTEGNTLLHTTVVNGNTATFNGVLEKANDIINQESLNKDTDLKGNKSQKATHPKDKHAITTLTDYINKTNDNGYTALHSAVLTGFQHGIEVLIQNNADISITNIENNTLVHTAAINNKVKSIQKVIDTLFSESKEGSFIWKQELQRKNGISYFPVMLATEKSTIKIILKHFNPEEFVDEEHGSLFHWSTANNRTHLVSLLIEQGSINSMQTLNDKGMSPLSIACRWGYKQMTEILLMAGAKTNIIVSSQFTAMNFACQYGHFDVVQLLLQYGADLDSDEMEYSALHSAIFGGQIEISRFLLSTQNMDPNLYKSKGTPLYEAIKGGRATCVKLLLKNGANPQLSLDLHGYRPLHAAIKKNQRQAVKLLLAYGAGADETMFGGVTPAILAVENDQANILSLLIAEGINITKMDDSGNTIMHHIAMHQAYLCAENLNQHADLFKVLESSIYENENFQNLTPIEIALAKQEERILTIFVSLTPGQFFTDNPKIIHDLYDNKYYNIIKIIFSKMINSTSTNFILSTKFLESNSLGQYPNDANFQIFEPTLLHKLRDCPDTEIKYHPMVNAVVTEKLRLYNWWYTVSFVMYIFFLACLTHSLYQSSWLCNYYALYPLGLTSTVEIARFATDIYTLVFVVFFAINEILEFFINWHQTFKDKSLEHKSKHKRHIQKSFFSEERQISETTAEGIRRIFLNMTQNLRTLDRFLFYFFSSIISFYDSYNIFDSAALFFFTFFVVFRTLKWPIQWTFASLSYIAFILSLFKYSRIFPSLGSYVQSIIRIYKIDIPRYVVIVVILLIAFYGGIHLASRQGEFSTNPFVPVVDDSTCNISRLNWIPSQIDGLRKPYDHRLGLLTGLVFLLDGGPSEYLEGLVDVNFLFLIVYFLFAFAIIIVMSNILIAQLTQTYSQIIKIDKFHYKIDLVLTFELKSNLAFLVTCCIGSNSRRLAAFNRMTVPLHLWNAMKDESPEKESDLKVNEILNIVSTGADKILENSRKMNRIEDNLDTISVQLQDLNEDISTIQIRMGQKGEKTDLLKKQTLARVPNTQSVGLERRIDAMEQKLDLILVRIGSLS